jgi:hypothetical protein
MKWIHRDDHRPKKDQDIVAVYSSNEICTGFYLGYDDEISALDGYIKWEAVLAWMPKEDFIFPKEEDFE